MNSQTILSYDGSFDGFLCAIFMIYEQKIKKPIITNKERTNNTLFSTIEEVITEEYKAKRVWKGIKSKISGKELTFIFKAFLSEIKGVENTLLNYIQTVLSTSSIRGIDYSNQDILKISKVAKMVGREKHRMEAFVRFKLTRDNIYVASVSPDFNVLPLITHHFKDRYADQKWLIYDTKRNYGIFYNLRAVEIITMDNFTKIDGNSYTNDDLEFQKLWATYYDSVNIKSRKNMKLHIQHIPKRYWKYLTEKKHILK